MGHGEPTSRENAERTRLSCTDASFPRLSHSGALGVISDLGVGAVDVCVFAGYDHNPPAVVAADPAGRAEAVAARLEEHGLAVADVFAILAEAFEDLAVNNPDRSVRDESARQFDAMLEFAVRLGSPGLTILPGAVFPGVDEGESLELAARELEWRADKAGEAGLRLRVEPHFRSIIPTPLRTAAFLERTQNVGLALDISHFAFQGYDQSDSDPLLPRTTHVHLRQARPGHIQARTYEGTIDYPKMRDQLFQLGYDGFFTLEYAWEEWLDFTRVDCISETAETRDLMLGKGGERG
jgi:sugar phosphate isomerase/epimerase